MGGIKYISYFLLCGLFLFQSCNIEKRRYRGGYYVHNNNYAPPKNPRVLHPENDSISVEQVKNSIVVSKQKEKEHAKELIVTIDKKQQLFLPYRSITLPAPGDTCDTLILRNGTEIKTRILEITTELVRYRHCDNPDGPIYNMPINNVAMIIYKNGTKDDLKLEKQELMSRPEGTYVSPKESNEEKVKKKANATLIWGILGFLLVVVYLVGIVFAIIAIENAISFKKWIKREPYLYKESDMRKVNAGLILGILLLSLVVLAIIILIALLAGALRFFI